MLLFWATSLIRVFAQDKIWDNTLGGYQSDELKAMVVTPDRGYLLGGTSWTGKSGDKSTSRRGANDYWVLKTDKNGIKEWDKSFGGSGQDELQTMIATPDGGFLLGGFSSSGKSGEKSEANRGGNNGTYDYWVVKIGANGTKQWDKTFGSNDFDELKTLVATPDGGYLLGGSSQSGGISGDKTQENKGWIDYWVIKVDAKGNKLWDKTYGGNDEDKLLSMVTTPDGGYLLGGHSTSGKSGDKSETNRGLLQRGFYETSDYWVVKVDANGNKIWDKTFGGSEADHLTTIALTKDGGYLLGGSSYSTASGDKTEVSRGSGDYWLVKINSNGKKLWDKTLGGNDYDQLTAIVTIPGYGYLLGGWSFSGIAGDKLEANRGREGYTTYDYWIIKIDENGNRSWDKTIGGNLNDELAALAVTDKGYLLAGTSSSAQSGDKSEPERVNDYWIVELQESGKNWQSITFEPVLNKTLDNKPFPLFVSSSSKLPVTLSVVSGPAILKNNIITLTGTGLVTIKASQAGDDRYFPAQDVYRSFLVENVSAFTKLWDKRYGGNFYDYFETIISTPEGGYLLGGDSDSERSSDKSEASRGRNDYWIVKTDSKGVKLWDKRFGGNGIENLGALVPTPDGGYLLGGFSDTGKNGDKTQPNKGYLGSTDYWIIKLDSDGNKIWDKTFGSNFSEFLTVIIPTADGGYLLGGYSNSDNGADKTEASRGERSFDYWLVKIDGTGTKQWDKTFGGIGDDNLTSIISTRDGGYLVGGFSNSGKEGDKSEANKGHSTADFWVVKIDGSGNKQWDKTLGGTGTDELSGLLEIANGRFLLSGSSDSKISGDKTQNSYGGKDYWLLQMDDKGKKLWDKTYGGNSRDKLNTLATTLDGGYLLGGESNSKISGAKSQINRGGTDYWVIKINNSGEILWDKTIGGTGNDELFSVMVNPDGSYLLGGTSRSEIGGEKSEASRGFADYWLVKTKEAQPFTAQWNMRYGGSGTDNLTSVTKTSDGGYLSGGYTNSGVGGDKSQPSQGKYDYWIVKSDKNGKKLWDKRYGGSEDDFLNRVYPTRDGGYLLGGSSLSGNSGDKTEANRGNWDYWIVKVDKQGNKEWDKTFGGSSSDNLRKVLQLPSGEYVLGGNSGSPKSGDKSQASWGSSDYWIIKLSSTGEKLWDKRYGGNLEEKLGSFSDTQGGGFLLAGSSYSGISGDKSQVSQGNNDFWLVQIDQDGNLLWEKTLGGNGQEEVYTLGRSNGTNLFVAGTSTSGKSGDKSQASRGKKDYWLVKIDAKGTKLWDKTYGGSQDDELRFSEFATGGHYILAGYSYSGIGGDKTQASQGSSDYWIVEADEKGEKIVDQRFGGSGTEELRTIFQTKDGGLLLGGRSDSGVSGDRTQPSQGGMDYWLVKVAPVSSPIVAAREALPMTTEPVKEAKLNLLKVYPNPFRDRVTVSFTLPQTQPVSVKVYNNQGKELTTLFRGEAKADQTYEVEWQANNQAAGLYFLQMQTPTTPQQQKLLLTR
ncbi:T9SS type A sorting domain-containing protein [Adhaeribacter radiodurans]|uniref:T9SS type A sorting domain-containing protein n=1 Tax=Adhaeribacter radiodurans TaxID=2745197 RepID=A0A7L7LE46_9BACT|nr:T9SS type A sorting domain-containing protein [Adhaeribacter radiodurans]QMU31043.1 T9SS type A sorting domain-containing protein [Adhaeribacter radiodurans]